MAKGPRLLPQPNIRWGGYPYKEDPIQDMCDYGARKFREGYCDIVNFDCAPGEDVAIRAYMAATHPTVPIMFGAPSKALKTVNPTNEES
jgi:hypothetical protein